MFRYLRNGQATLGSSTFWRIDDTKAMEAPDYDPIAFLMAPAMLLSLKTFPNVSDVDALLKQIHGEPALENLRRAIEDKGPNPEYHDAQMARLEREWPSLWRVITELLAATNA